MAMNTTDFPKVKPKDAHTKPAQIFNVIHKLKTNALHRPILCYFG